MQNETNRNSLVEENTKLKQQVQNLEDIISRYRKQKDEFYPKFKSEVQFLN